MFAFDKTNFGTHYEVIYSIVKTTKKKQMGLT